MSFPCVEPNCTGTFRTQAQLNKHKYDHHTLQITVTIQNKSFVCLHKEHNVNEYSSAYETATVYKANIIKQKHRMSNAPILITRFDLFLRSQPSHDDYLSVTQWKSPFRSLNDWLEESLAWLKEATEVHW
ncbi:hypothetical protein BCV71DRAFT_233200 [Rhizopus microsporus]|uniref:C2H2-type domain-containing protein n=1 Tax=Rhizopus microsporus TaxID=58291 RepID=A0A1X0S8E1_RHIZD|nr:hypothetical protein BCV71DRAFT_233200 [Rhizopus microsporus]